MSSIEPNPSFTPTLACRKWKLHVQFIRWLSVLGTISCLLCSCSESKSTQKVQGHNVVIIETHMLGGGHRSTIQGVQGGPQVFTYEGRSLKVRLAGEVPTVNGKKYLILKNDDSIG